MRELGLGLGQWEKNGPIQKVEATGPEDSVCGGDEGKWSQG